MTLRKIKAKKLGSTQQAWTGQGIKLSETSPLPHCGNTSMRELARAALGGRKPISDRVKKAHESSCISERASSFARLSWRLENWSSRTKSMLISRELKRHKCIRNIVLYWGRFSTRQYFLIQQHFLFVFFIVLYQTKTVMLKHCRDSFLFFRYGATNNHMTPSQEFILVSSEGLQPSSSIQWRCLFGIHDSK